MDSGVILLWRLQSNCQNLDVKAGEVTLAKGGTGGVWGGGLAGALKVQDRGKVESEPRSQAGMWLVWPRAGEKRLASGVSLIICTGSEGLRMIWKRSSLDVSKAQGL